MNIEAKMAIMTKTLLSQSSKRGAHLFAAF
jgi:hypothetical protein